MFRLIFFLAILIPAQAVAGECDHVGDELRCVKYVDNYDADTVKFNIHDVHWLMGKKISVRVLGVDTPEIKGQAPCEKEKALAAKAKVKELLTGAKRIDIVKIGRDKYFRILGDIMIDGKSLSELLIAEKLAYPYFGDTKLKVDWCHKLDFTK